MVCPRLGITQEHAAHRETNPVDIINNRIPMIKALREASGLGLKECKDTIDAMVIRFCGPDVPAVIENSADMHLVERGRCAACGQALTGYDRDAVFCSVACFCEHRDRVYAINQGREMDVRIARLEAELKALRSQRENYPV